MAETLHGLDGGMPGRPALHVGLELPDGAQRGVDHDLGPVADAGIMTTPLDACAALPREGAATSFDGRLEDHRDWAAGHPAPSVALRRFLAFWTRMHGALSLELAGRFTGMDFDPALLFAAEPDELPAVRP